MSRRKVTPTSFSFLDIMFCGFGSVVLLVMILNGDMLKKREQHSQDLRAELKRVTILEDLARTHFKKLTKKIQISELQEGELKLKTNNLSSKVRDASKKVKQVETETKTLQKSIANMQAQTTALTNATRLLRSKNAEKWKSDKKPIGFSGDGRRQYLTGLKLGGARTLILLDSSSSMLDETVINVVRRKLMNPATRRNAPKWQRALRTLHWLIANLRPWQKFQVYQFNTKANALINGTEGKWLSTDDANSLTNAISASRKISPLGGTSLHQAFSVIKQLKSKPDSVILLTDGLPTQGKYTSKMSLVSSEERLSYFRHSINNIPVGTSINTLLFPMEGDPLAAGAFWQLAVSTKGSFITPSRDWP